MPTNQGLQPILRGTAIPYRPAHDIFTRSTTPVVLHHEQWRKPLGTADVSVPNVGFQKRGNDIWRNPLFIMSDPIKFVLGSDGNPGYGTGLMSTDGLEYPPFVQILNSIVANQRFGILPIDQHTDETEMLNGDALTEIALTESLFQQMTAKDQRNAQRWFPDKMEIPGVRAPGYLTVAEAQALFGPYRDSEFKDWLFPMPHGIEGKAIWTPEVDAVLAEARRANRAAMQNGETAPVNYIYPVHKNGLFGNVSPNIRGLYGNHYDALMQASQNGMPQGPAYNDQRRVVICGMGTPFSAFNEVLHALDNSFQVTIMVSATFHFDPAGITKFECIRQLRMSYPYATRAFYYWNEDALGMPEPKNYNRQAQQVRDQDRQNAATAGVRASNTFYAFSDPDMPMKVIEDWE